VYKKDRHQIKNPAALFTLLPYETILPINFLKEVYFKNFK